MDRNSLPLPWSGSTTSSSPLTDPFLGSSREERVPEELKNEPQSADMMGRRSQRGETREEYGERSGSRARGEEIEGRTGEKEGEKKNDVGDERQA